MEINRNGQRPTILRGIGSLPTMTRDQLLCGETDLGEDSQGMPEQLEVTGQSAYDTALANWRRANRAYIDTYRGIWSYPSHRDFLGSRPNSPELPTGSPEEEPESRLETTPASPTLELRDPGSMVTGRQEEEVSYGATYEGRTGRSGGNTKKHPNKRLKK